MMKAGETVVGFVAFADNEITWLYVSPDHYRRGIRRVLLRQIAYIYLETRFFPRPGFLWVSGAASRRVNRNWSFRSHLTRTKTATCQSPKIDG